MVRFAQPTGAWESYLPDPRQQLFHAVPAVSGWLTKGYIGALGGGKSTACENEFIQLCLSFPMGQSVAMRRSIQGRAELSVLKDLKRLLLPTGIAQWVASEQKFVFPKNGHEAYILSGENWEKLGSMEISHYFLQEAQECSHQIFKTLNARLRCPSAKVNGQPYYRGLFDARGIDRGHWIYTEFIEKAWDVDTPADRRMSAENPDFVYIKSQSTDNSHLPPGYIESRIRENKDNQAWIDVFIKGEIGVEVEGRAVYGDSFDARRHVAEISEDPSLRIMRGWDFGYRAPAVVWTQWTRSGRLLVLSELCPKNLSTDSLIDLAQAHQANLFPRRSSEFYMDYADHQGIEVQSTSSLKDLEILESRLNTEVFTRKGNIEYGLNVVRNLMLKQVKVTGQLVPRFAVDKSCETLIAALKGSYSYPEDKLNAPPNKGGSYVGVCDAMRYVAQLVVEEDMTETYGGYGSKGQETVVGRW